MVLRTSLSGYPFIRKMLLSFSSSAGRFCGEQIMRALCVKDLTKLIFLPTSQNELHLVYSPVNDGLRYTVVQNPPTIGASQRSILSMTKSAQHRISHWLVKVLDPVLKSYTNNCVSDSFTFVVQPLCCFNILSAKRIHVFTMQLKRCTAYTKSTSCLMFYVYDLLCD